jgi:hypothetical protein
VLFQELSAFGNADLRERLRLGGLPQVLLGDQDPEDFFPEWLDSYFARDVQELFRLEKRSAFLRVLQILMRQSGGLLDITKLAAAGEVSRITVANWLNVYEVTHTIRIVRPFSGGGRREIVAQPRVFGFDTGLICHARGWDRLRNDDCGGARSCTGLCVGLTGPGRRPPVPQAGQLGLARAARAGTPPTKTLRLASQPPPDQIE